MDCSHVIPCVVAAMVRRWEACRLLDLRLLLHAGVPHGSEAELRAPLHHPDRRHRLRFRRQCFCISLVICAFTFSELSRFRLRAFSSVNNRQPKFDLRICVHANTDRVVFAMQVLPTDTSETPPDDGAYVHGLFLDCARWDKERCESAV